MVFLTIFLAVLAFIVFLVLFTYIYTTWNHGIFKRMGVPGPEPKFLGILGDLKEEGVAMCDQKLTQKYGRVVGVFHGRKPSLLVTDPEMIKQIFVKDFSNFVNRGKWGPVPRIVLDCISEIYDEHWKYMRCVLNPTFSTGKLKQMNKLIDVCVEKLVRNVERHAVERKNVELKYLMGCYTLDVIANTGFSIDLDSQNNKDDIFVKYCKKAMTLSFPILYFVAVIYPFLTPLIERLNYSLTPKEDDKTKFHTMLKQVIEDRRKSPETGQRDLLQLMINAHKADSSKDPDDDEDDDTPTKLDFQYFKKRGLTDYEIFCNSNIFMLAGYDTSSNCLTFAVYLLATHPDIQEKLYREITDSIGKEKPDYYQVIKLQLLENIVFETLRMYPPALRLSRRPEKDTVIGGYHIPAKMGVVFPLYALHHDPELWPDPEKFDPDRFLPENRSELHDYKWLPFGIGPRNCLGMRLGLLEVKEALIVLLQRYRFVVTPETEVPVTIEKGAFTRPQNDLFVGVERRE